MISIEELIRTWDSEDMRALNRRLLHLEERVYHTYEPSLPPKSQYRNRLEKWLNNPCISSDEDRKTLLRLAAEIFYVSSADFVALYREAFNGPIARFLIDSAQIDLEANDTSTKIQEALSATWFCPITDSLRINSFCHVNDVPSGHDYRPDWRSLAKFGDKDKVSNFIKEAGIKFIVLLEDFVGRGTQMIKPVKFATSISEDIKVLAIPLICCPAGVENGEALVKQFSNFSFSPIVSISTANLLAQQPVPDEHEFLDKLRQLVLATYANVSNGKAVDDEAKPYGPFGWKPKEPTGAMIVMYSNTPNNSLPIIHHQCNSWDALFPRHERV